MRLENKGINNSINLFFCRHASIILRMSRSYKTVIKFYLRV